MQTTSTSNARRRSQRIPRIQEAQASAAEAKNSDGVATSNELPRGSVVSIGSGVPVASRTVEAGSVSQVASSTSTSSLGHESSTAESRVNPEAGVGGPGVSVVLGTANSVAAAIGPTNVPSLALPTATISPTTSSFSTLRGPHWRPSESSSSPPAPQFPSTLPPLPPIRNYPFNVPTIEALFPENAEEQEDQVPQSHVDMQTRVLDSRIRRLKAILLAYSLDGMVLTPESENIEKELIALRRVRENMWNDISTSRGRAVINSSKGGPTPPPWAAASAHEQKAATSTLGAAASAYEQKAATSTPGEAASAYEQKAATSTRAESLTLTAQEQGEAAIAQRQRAAALASMESVNAALASVPIRSSSVENTAAGTTTVDHILQFPVLSQEQILAISKLVSGLTTTLATVTDHGQMPVEVTPPRDVESKSVIPGTTVTPGMGVAMKDVPKLSKNDDKHPIKVAETLTAARNQLSDVVDPVIYWKALKQVVARCDPISKHTQALGVMSGDTLDSVDERVLAFFGKTFDTELERELQYCQQEPNENIASYNHKVLNLVRLLRKKTYSSQQTTVLGYVHGLRQKKVRTEMHDLLDADDKRPADQRTFTSWNILMAKAVEESNKQSLKTSWKKDRQIREQTRKISKRFAANSSSTNQGASQRDSEDTSSSSDTEDEPDKPSGRTGASRFQKPNNNKRKFGG